MQHTNKLPTPNEQDWIGRMAESIAQLLGLPATGHKRQLRMEQACASQPITLSWDSFGRRRNENWTRARLTGDEGLPTNRAVELLLAKPNEFKS